MKNLCNANFGTPKDFPTKTHTMATELYTEFFSRWLINTNSATLDLSPGAGNSFQAALFCNITRHVAVEENADIHTSWMKNIGSYVANGLLPAAVANVKQFVPNQASQERNVSRHLVSKQTNCVLSFLNRTINLTRTKNQTEKKRCLMR
jgi:hypothetical protein